MDQVSDTRIFSCNSRNAPKANEALLLFILGNKYLTVGNVYHKCFFFGVIRNLDLAFRKFWTGLASAFPCQFLFVVGNANFL